MSVRITRMNQCAQQLCTLGPIGYVKGSGTIATLITLPVVLYIHAYTSLSFVATFLCITSIIAFVCIKKSLSFFYSKDPREIVIDEFIGSIVAFYAIPLNWFFVFMGFALFRLFDITKWCGIWRIDRYNGAFAIIADDIAAGLLTNLVLHLIAQLASYYAIALV